MAKTHQIGPARCPTDGRVLGGVVRWVVESKTTVYSAWTRRKGSDVVVMKRHSSSPAAGVRGRGGGEGRGVWEPR